MVAAGYVHAVDADDSFAQSAVTPTGGIGTTEVFETANLDGDVFPELVFQIGSAVRIMQWSASGGVVIRTELVVPDEPDVFSSGTGRLSIGDLNNDSLDDIAVISGGLYVFLRHQPSDRKHTSHYD